MMKAKNAALAFVDLVDQHLRASPNLVTNLKDAHALTATDWDVLRPEMP